MSQEVETMLVYKGKVISATMQITSIKTPGSSLKKTWWTLRSFLVTLAGLLTSAPLFLSCLGLWNTLMYYLTKRDCCFFRPEGTRERISCGVEWRSEQMARLGLGELRTQLDSRHRFFKALNSLYIKLLSRNFENEDPSCSHSSEPHISQTRR